MSAIDSGHDQRVELGAGVQAVSDRGAAGTGADRKALAEPGRDVGDAEGHELAIGVDLMARLGGEALAGQHGVGVRDHRQAERGRQQGDGLGPAHLRQRSAAASRPESGRRAAGRSAPDAPRLATAAASNMAIKVQGRRGNSSAADEEHHQHGRSHDHRRQIDLRQVRQDVCQAVASTEP